MEEEKSSMPEAGGDASPQQIGKLKGRHQVMTWVLAGVVVLLLAGVGYLWWQLQAAKKDVSQLNKDKQQLRQQVDGLNQEADESINPAGGSELTACTYTPGTSLKDNIKAALDSKNTAAFSTYTTDPVKYVLAASEYGGDVSAAEAATSLEYTHSATGPWDFSLSGATIAAYDGGSYADYFEANTLVGKAASGMVVAFEFNCDGSKITNIFVAADEDTL